MSSVSRAFSPSNSPIAFCWQPRKWDLPINQITALPDAADAAVLSFYNAGILTGVDDWGTFAPDKTLTRAETAAMVARVARPELRESFSPADYAMFTAAYLKPADVLFTNGVTAGQYLPYVQALIDGLEADCAAQGMDKM